jgi:hypothetical protein
MTTAGVRYNMFHPHLTLRNTRRCSGGPGITDYVLRHTLADTRIPESLRQWARHHSLTTTLLSQYPGLWYHLLVESANLSSLCCSRIPKLRRCDWGFKCGRRWTDTTPFDHRGDTIALVALTWLLSIRLYISRHLFMLVSTCHIQEFWTTIKRRVIRWCGSGAEHLCILTAALGKSRNYGCWYLPYVAKWNDKVCI